ncbi:cobalamin-dependent protein [Actinokineospora sp. PR83]|uniref:cobalamin B12-binding domain-containing protein n=1 Tax=Actinokineospora sp. PR83 TaxID=2884908 RepID=UPI001EEC0672|nr:cobalamin-dependent protein [Actinokineospora sp. PR83]MCG8914806.1 cobalamin-dependent protein [Actinokineospora sp. PR83]
MGGVARRVPLVLLSSVSSDSHTWNLVFLQLLLEEAGHQVVNLGACVPDGLLIAEVGQRRPDAVVISTVNGHGRVDGARLVTALRSHPFAADLPVVIGGKLGVSGPDPATAEHLLRAGFTAVFQDDAGPEHLIGTLRAALEPAPVGAR